LAVYRVSGSVLTLSGLLILSAAVFSLSHAAAGLDGAKMVIIFVVMVFICFNFITLFFRRLEVDGDEVKLTTIYGRKSINISRLEEIGVIKLKMRVIIILSDPERFVFVSSYYGAFGEFLDYLKDRAGKELHESIEKIDRKYIRNKKTVLNGVLVVMNLFFLGSAVYNFINH
jgi:hypothetical protein